MDQTFQIACLFGIPAHQGLEIGVALHQGAQTSHQQGYRLVPRPTQPQKRSQVLIRDETESFFFSKRVQSFEIPQARQQPVPTVPVQKPFLPGGHFGRARRVAQTIVDDGQPAAVRQ